MRKTSPRASSLVQPCPAGSVTSTRGARRIERGSPCMRKLLMRAPAISADVGLGQREAAPVFGPRQPAGSSSAAGGRLR